MYAYIATMDPCDTLVPAVVNIMTASIRNADFTEFSEAQFCPCRVELATITRLRLL